MLDLSGLGPAGDDERLRAIQDVVAHAKRIDIEVARAKPIESVSARPFVLAALAFPLLFVTAYSYGARSEWLFGPDPSRREETLRDAHARYAMYLTAERVEARRDSAGFLPGTLDDAQGAFPGVTYRAIGDSGFEVRGPAAAAAPLVLESADDPRAFLGDAAASLRERPR